MQYDAVDRTMNEVWLRLNRCGMKVMHWGQTSVSMRQANAWASRNDLRFRDDDGNWEETGLPEGDGEQGWIDLMVDWGLDPKKSYECYDATVPVEFWGGKRAALAFCYKSRLRYAQDDMRNPSCRMDHATHAEMVSVTADMYGVEETDL